MASLFTYMQQTQRFLRDTRQELLDPQDLITYINQARRETAMRSQAIRRLPQISGAVKRGTVLTPGSGYTAPVGTITPPDWPNGSPDYPNGRQATALVSQVGGQIVSVNIQDGGSGYFQPTITITDPTGTGATASLQTSLLNVTQQGQEIYPFSGVDLSPFPGIESIYMVQDISILFSNYRFSLGIYPFSQYQAKIRSFAQQYQFVPQIGAQFGQGVDGSFYLYPIASQPYQMEWDCFCIPSDLTTDNDYEALPDPWCDAVPYWAAHLAFMELQSYNNSRFYKELFDERVTRLGAYARPGRTSSPYGRPLK